ncbi:MAG TPA: right-handed parallel beta-helix repeat-containing protein, partial [Tepidiformaceae bacterium]|nr:right-handed parallel beta-helix repeat-containing protein [Tepidiformaceae bacterium]
MSESSWRGAGKAGLVPLSTRKLLLPLAVLALLAALVASQSGPAQLAHAVPTGPTTVIVKPSTMTAAGWAFEDDNGNGGYTAGFEAGPGTPPAGTGSAQFVLSAANAGVILYNRTTFANQPLSGITALSYWTYRSSADSGNLLAPSLQMDVDFDSTDASTSWQGRLVFEPYQTAGVSGTILSDTWHKWDALSGEWWLSKPPIVGGAVQTNPCPQASPCSWATITGDFPNAVITSGLGFKAGSGWTSFDGNVDDLAITTTTLNKVFDFEPETPCTTACYVNAATGNDSFGGDTATSAKKTIQGALSQVSAGGTVYVAAGTYNENVNITKAVTLRGPNDGVAGNATRSAEAIIDGGGAANSLTIGADNVTVDGFTIQDGVVGVAYSGAWTNSTVENSVITNNQIGAYPSCSASCHLSFNFFTANNTTGAAGGAGVYTDVATDGLTVDDNVFQNHAINSAIIFAAVASATHKNLNITNNYISNNNADNSMIYLVAVDGATITGNTVIQPGATALKLAGDDTNITVTGNAFTGSGTGVKVADDGYGLGENANVVINDNDVSGNATGVANTDAGYTGLVDATCNWWGSADGPGGTGASPASGNVMVSPWLVTTNLTTPQCTSPAPPSGGDISNSNNAVLGTDGSSVELGSTGFSATYNGTGTVYTQLATYSGDPGADTGNFFGTGSQFFDVFATVLSNDPSATLTVTFPGLVNGQVLRWWDGTAWQTIVSNDGTTPVVASGGTTASSTDASATVIFGAASSPTLNELNGTPTSSGDPNAIEVQLVSGNSVTAGQQVTVQVVAKATALQAVDVSLDYNPAFLKVIGCSNITLGPTLTPIIAPGYTSSGSVTACAGAQDGAEFDDTNGHLRFTYAQNAGTPVSGNDIILATITFTGQAANNITSTSITVDSSVSWPTKFSDNNGGNLALTLSPAVTLSGIGGGGAVIAGTVQLQGRTTGNWAGTTVTLINGTDVLTATTAADGTFSIAVTTI